ncbi:MAG: hypothetical protein Tsb0020_23410 [Haliangiales bacterium]
MSTERPITFSDLTRAAQQRNPAFASLVIAYLEQPDPPENAPEEPITAKADNYDYTRSDNSGTFHDNDDDDDFDDDDDDDFDDDDDDFDDDDDDEVASEVSSPGRDAWTLSRLQSALAQHNMWGKSPTERKSARQQAWTALMAAPYPPPRLRLGAVLIELYEDGADWARASLIEIFRSARLCWGLWRGFKYIYKQAEQRHDAEMFGILAWRVDAGSQTPVKHGEVSGATLSYLRRRAWRYLRQLGQSVPELYPQFAVQVLRHYPAEFWFSGTWIANQIWAHEDLKGARSAWQSQAPDKLDRRAFDDAWRSSSAPLLRLLEDAANDQVASFAIRSLRADFAEQLEAVDVSWLARIGGKPLASVHRFVVELLENTPSLHQSQLRERGLHDMVLGFLFSADSKAAAYAVEYAKAHAPDIDIDTLVKIADAGSKAARELARARLAGKSPAALGLPVLVRMLAVSALEKLATEKFQEGFDPDDIDADIYVALALGSHAQQRFIANFYKQKKRKVPAAFLRAHAEWPRLSSWERRRVLRDLGKRKAADIGIDWIQQALLDPRFYDEVSSWLRAGILKGNDLDVDWVRGLAMRPRLRPLALELLGNPKLVAPSRVGLSWLLAMARQADDSLSSFAHRYLLEHFAPDDFALEAGATDVEVGVAKIWALIAPDQPAPVRRFAATYLRVHHPALGPNSSEARSLGIEPKLPRESYTLARVRPLFDDIHSEVRRLAAQIGRHELVAWGHKPLVYALARHRYREGRLLAAEALLHIGDSDADPKLVPPVEWLAASEVFALAECPIKSTREIALTLVRRHYNRLGGAERLGWLMESPDREVRLFAVRLLWDRHRPLPHPKAAAPAADGDTAEHERFSSTAAIQQFLRTVLFGLPPGRMERREGSRDALPERPLPASQAKRRLIDVVRDMGIEDAQFAAMVAPVLGSFTHSQAKGEWQACVAALARIRATHPDIETTLPPPLDAQGHGARPRTAPHGAADARRR